MGNRKFCSLFTTIRDSLLYFLLLTFALFSGCATSEDVGRMQWDLNELRSEVKGIKQKSQALESHIPGQEVQLNKRLKALEEEQRATSSAVSDLLLKTQSLTTELQVMTGRFEEARYFSEKNIKEFTESKDALIAQVKELEVTVKELKKKLENSEAAAVAAEKQKPVGTVKKAEEAREEKSAPKKEVEDAYLEAYKTYKAHQFEEAREKFQAILKGYPENEYSDNARFWIGEAYYKEKNYADAILAYEELFKKNPDSDKVPGAMLKQGLAFYELNENEIGRITLEKLIEKFPESKEAKLAKKKISPQRK